MKDNPALSSANREVCVLSYFPHIIALYYPFEKESSSRSFQDPWNINKYDPGDINY